MWKTTQVTCLQIHVSHISNKTKKIITSTEEICTNLLFRHNELLKRWGGKKHSLAIAEETSSEDAF